MARIYDISYDRPPKASEACRMLGSKRGRAVSAPWSSGWRHATGSPSSTTPALDFFTRERSKVRSLVRPPFPQTNAAIRTRLAHLLFNRRFGGLIARNGRIVSHSLSATDRWNLRRAPLRCKRTLSAPAPRCSASRPTASGATAPVTRAGRDNTPKRILTLAFQHDNNLKQQTLSKQPANALFLIYVQGDH